MLKSLQRVIYQVPDIAGSLFFEKNNEPREKCRN